MIIFYIFECLIRKKNLFEEDYTNNYIEKTNSISEKIQNFISYSRYLEDFILYCIFYDVENGFYIDINADSDNPTNYSDTKAFYLKGWYGLNIVNFKNKMSNFLKYRKRDINIQMDVRSEEDNTTFHFTKNSKLNKNNLNQNNKSFLYHNTIKNIFIKYIPKHEEIQFCKINIKKEEINVLLEYDFENFRPKLFLIKFKNFFYINLCDKILLKNNYSLVYQNKMNRFYIDIRIKYLRQKFIEAKKYLNISIK